MSTDLRIHGATIQTPTGPLDADLLVADGMVAGLVGRETPVDTAETIEATGHWILPGIVDMHVHARVPGYEYKEDFGTASRAAAVGGVTTFVDMPNLEPPTTTVELLAERRALAERDAHVDFGHFASSRN